MLRLIVVRVSSARALAVTVLTLITALVAVAPAGAASIVFMKGANVWLASSDGSVQRQVTTAGGWDSPSQADDGTILAQNGTQLFRLNRYGQQLVPAINTDFTGAPSTAGAGPVNAVISPDGVNQAYDGEVNANPYYDPGCNCWVYVHQFATWWGSATQYSEPNQTSGQQDYVDPAWIDNSHLLLKFSYGSGSARSVGAGSVKLAIKPTAGAMRAVSRAGRVLVSITITFTPTGGTPRTIHVTVTIAAQRKTHR